MNTELFYKNPLLVIYVPGYLSGEDKQKEVKDKLSKLYPDSPITIFNWDSVSSYAIAMHNSIKASNDLVQYLKELPCGNYITIIGHSLGALVVSNVMKKIPFNSYYGAKQVILLGAAISTHENLKHMCEVTAYPVINVVNRNDIILNTLYKTFNNSPALGSRGLCCKYPDNYVELNVLHKIPQVHKSNSMNESIDQLLDVTGHSSSRVYLDALVNNNYTINS